MMEFTGMAQVDQAFALVGSRRRAGRTGVHFGVNSLVQNVHLPLYAISGSSDPRARRSFGPAQDAARLKHRSEEVPSARAALAYGLSSVRQRAAGA